MLIELKYKKLWIEILTLIIFILEGFILINGRRFEWMGTIINMFVNDTSGRVKQYFSTTTNGSIKVVILVLLNLLLTWMCYKYLVEVSYDNNLLELYRKVLYCSILQLIWIPLLWLNVEFYRFPRNMLMFTYILFINSLVHLRNALTIKKIKICIVFLINTILWIWVAYYSISNWEAIFFPIFYENALFN